MNLFHLHSAERSTSDQSYFFPQHQKVYTFCLDKVRGKNVLEIGSGSGFGTSRLAKVVKSVVAIDNDEKSILRGRKRFKAKNLRFEVLDFESWIPKQVRDEKYDVIIALQFLEHVRDAEATVKKMRTLLKPGGILFLSTPNSLTQSYNENPYHFKEFTPDELRKVLNKYFTHVEQYGLFGDKMIQHLEDQRRQQVLKFFRVDRLRLRKFIPRSFRQVMFDVASSLRSESSETPHISESNFQIKKGNFTEAIDLIAVCK